LPCAAVNRARRLCTATAPHPARAGIVASVSHPLHICQRHISFPAIFLINDEEPAVRVGGGADNQMEELVNRLVAELGIDRQVAEQAVGIILAFLVKEAPADKIKPLLDAMPGAQDAAAAAPSGGMFGMGGLMGVGSQLMGLGLGMGDVQNVARSLLAYAREKIGADATGELVGAIPGLAQFA
jgi:hypothetical protein